MDTDDPKADYRSLCFGWLVFAQERPVRLPSCRSHRIGEPGLKVQGSPSGVRFQLVPLASMHHRLQCPDTVSYFPTWCALGAIARP